MKLFELAKELSVKSKVLMDILNETIGEDEKKAVAMTVLTDEQIEFLRSEVTTEKKESKPIVEEKKVKTDADYRPDEMIPCHSVFEGVLYFYGRHTGMTYKFVGAGDRRNVEYQDLKAGMLEHVESMYNPDIVIDDENLINDEHWWEIKEIYSDMYNEDEIKKVMNLPLRDFKTAYPQLPITAKNTIISIFASQIENGTFEQYNKAKYIDEVSGTRFDLTM